jgi:Ca2+-dependent lipid-binding protein
MFVAVDCSCILLSGFNPRWNQKMIFSLKVPELAMVHFAVKDSSTTGKDAMLGMYALPFGSIQQGRVG